VLAKRGYAGQLVSVQREITKIDKLRLVYFGVEVQQLVFIKLKGIQLSKIQNTTWELLQSIVVESEGSKFFELLNLVWNLSQTGVIAKIKDLNLSEGKQLQTYIAQLFAPQIQ
jgi:hypothetical protein